MQNESCISRCGGFIYKYQEKPSGNTDNRDKRKSSVTSAGFKAFKLERDNPSRNTVKFKLGKIEAHS